MKDLYTENYKAWTKEILKDLKMKKYPVFIGKKT